LLCGNTVLTLTYSESKDIAYDPNERTVTVRGPELFVISVAQQLAWLGAACRESVGQVAFCYTKFSELEVENLRDGISGPMFEIGYEVSTTGLEASDSCWHSLVGNSVIATGFPIPPRSNGEIGLQSPLELMAALARIPLATRYFDGYVFKGRSIILVPVEKKGSSFQWHLFQKSGKSRIYYQDLEKLCPDRLPTKTFGQQDLETSTDNCFLGWCPQLKNSFGKS
jgi:hypothetical protein